MSTHLRASSEAVRENSFWLGHPCKLIWVVVVWLPSSPWSPTHAHPNDTSDRFPFRVKGGLVIELCFQVCLKDGLASFLGWPIFIFSPSPLDST